MSSRRVVPILVVVVLAALSARSVSAEPRSDVGARIKLLAMRHSNSVIVHGDSTTYYTYSLKSPRGYRAVLALTESPEEETISVEILESIRGEQRLTLLTDLAGDGKLDSSYTATGPSVDDAFLQIKTGRGTKQSVSTFESIYETLLFNLQQEVPLESASR